MRFKEWINLSEGILGYIIAACITEGRKAPDDLRSSDFSSSLFDTTPKSKQILGADACPINPLSGYDTHIKSIQKFAFSGPDQFAQTMLFSPLSANVPFTKHWDNFQVLMMILKHYFPKKVDPQKLEFIVDAFNDTYHAMAHTIAGFKYNTIADIWNNREKLFNELPKLSEEGDDEKLIRKLLEIHGVQSIKAGFIAQLLFGKAGCIDTHNIDIYTKVFPDMADEFDEKKWKGKDGAKNYVALLRKLEKEKKVGSKQLWDIWVDFVEHFYRLVSTHGEGIYADMGSSLNPDDPVYQAIKEKEIKIPKIKIGQSTKRQAMVPVVSGRHGMGASATHLQDDPDEMLKQFQRIQRGEEGSDASRAVPFRAGLHDPSIGMATQPSSLHYFGKALSDKGEVDPDRIRDIIDRRQKRGGKKAWAARSAKQQGNLF